jgi:MYXO-CTERM domain-containing protein
LPARGITANQEEEIMSKRFIAQACVAAALLSVSPAALAQNDTGAPADPALNTTTADPLATNTGAATDPLANDPLAAPPAADPMMTDPALNDPMMTNTTEPEEDNDFPWGLLGLLGLAGLLGLRRGDNRDVHVDNRRDVR